MAAKTLLVAALLLAATCQAISIQWTGYASNNQWTTNTNWYPDQIPGPQDDVTINSGDVIITTPVSVNSLTMGDSFSATANLTILSAFTVFETLTVEGNGNLLLLSGASAVSGTVNIGGAFVFSAGTISGTWTISKDAAADLAGAGEKAFSACGFSAAGAVTGSGVWLLNESSTVTVTSLTAAGNFVLQAGDTSAVSVMASTLTYNGGGTLLVQLPLTMTTFNFIAGNVTLINGVTFGSALTIPAGSVVRTLGLSVVTFSGGVFGAGELHALGYQLTAATSNMSGTVIAQAGSVTFGAGSYIDTLVLNGASLNLNGATFTIAWMTLNTGSVNGGGKLIAQWLAISTPGFDVNATIVVTISATASTSVLALTSQTGNLQIATGATLAVTGTVQLNGLGSFTNNGATTVSGMLSITNVGVSGTGSYAVSGSLSVSTNQVRAGSIALSGIGSFVGANAELFGISSITGGANGVKATIGEYTLKCKTECDSVTTAGIPTSTFAFQSA